MADCAILHTGTGGSTEQSAIWLGRQWQPLFGYSDGGETARFYIPVGALSIRAETVKTGTRSWDWWGNNNTHYWRTENTYQVTVTGWRRSSMVGYFWGPVRMGAAASEEPARFSDYSVSLYMPLAEQLLGHLAAEEGNAAYAIMMRQNTQAKSTGGTRTEYEIPCPAAILFEAAAGTEALPAFTGAAAAQYYSEREFLTLTRDETLFSGVMKTITDLYVDSGETGGEEHW